MPILFKCDLCRARLSIARKKAGKIGTCPKCGEAIRIPLVSQNLDEANKSDSKILAPTETTSSSDSNPMMKGVKSLASIEIEEQSGMSFESNDFSSPVSSEALSTAKDATVISDSITGLANDSIDKVEPESDPSPITSEGDLSSRMANVFQPDRHRISLPRWIVYFQAAMLAVCAATFFVFGLMVGNLTSTKTVQTESYQINGTVLVSDDGQDQFDEGAVVVFLPADEKPDPRPDGDVLNPNGFEPIDNPSIDLIRRMGGDVIRCSRDGEFETELPGRREYFVLVVSKSQRRSGNSEVPKKTAAELGRYFLPYDDLLGDHAYSWTRVKLNSDRNLKEVRF